MSGRAITTTITVPTDVAAVATTRQDSLSLSRAARELGLKRDEFDLAVQLGCVRTVPDEGGGSRRVARAEVDRVRSEQGFPEALRQWVEAVGTRDGAALMGVTPARFTRFARLGLVVPVKWYVNRCRAVVWLYLAHELRQFAAEKENAPLLTGRIPEGLRDQLDAGLDLRPRNWRGRHLGFQLRQTEDPWAKAAVVASLLDPARVAEIIRDPYERAQLHRLLPPRSGHGAPDSPTARVAGRIMTADDPDEIGWLRADLRQALIEARHHGPAARPSPEAPDERPPETATVRGVRTAHGTAARCGAATVCGNTTVRRAEAIGETADSAEPTIAPQPPPEPPEPTRSRGMFGWLRRRDP